jgi:diphthamide biosynthesis protein 3
VEELCDIPRIRGTEMILSVSASRRHILKPQDILSLSRPAQTPTMVDEDLNLYDEIEIEDCFYDATLQIYHHPCPCGDRFEISIADMRDGEDIARCPSCSLMIRIIFDEVGLTK